VRRHAQGVLKVAVNRWYTYVCDENEDTYADAFADTLAFHYHPIRALRVARTKGEFRQAARDFVSFNRARVLAHRPVLKDPFAVFSARWFERRLGCVVVVVVRRPEAVVSSLKRLNWPFDFRDLLEQPLLMRDVLHPWRDRLEEGDALPGDDVVGRGALLWSAVYGAVARYLDGDDRFQIVRHEDLARNPLAGFERLYEATELELTDRARDTIVRSTRRGNPVEPPPGNPFTTSLDSASSLDNWRHRLSDYEVARIRALTSETARLFYGSDELR